MNFRRIRPVMYFSGAARWRRLKAGDIRTGSDMRILGSVFRAKCEQPLPNL